MKKFISGRCATKNVNKEVLLIFLLAFTSPIFAQGDLMIFPKRIVFEGTENRVQTLHLTNTGKDTVTYRISYVQARMTEDGAIENISEPDPGQRFADPFLRFFPKTVNIAPNKSQLVKIQLIKTSELEPGEYRSHLYLRAVPKVEPLKKSKRITSEDTGLSINITPVYGYGMTNIIRIGEPDIQVRLSDIKLEKTDNSIPLLNLTFHRNGNMSSYGDINVEHVSHNGEKTRVADIKGFAIYSSNNIRKAKIKLEESDNIDYENGELRVIYTSQGTGKTTYSKATIEL